MTISPAEIESAPYTEDETLWERRFRFLSMRNGGGTFTAIAEHHNKGQRQAMIERGGDPDDAPTISPTTVRKDVLAAKERIITDSTREHMIAECASVIYDVRSANYQAMAAGNPDAGKLVLATVVAQREMFGLDEPKRSQIGVGTDIEFAETLLALLKSVGPDVQRELTFAAFGEREDRGAVAIDARPPIDVESFVREPGSTDLVKASRDETLELADDEPWSNVAETASVRPHADDGEDD